MKKSTGETTATVSRYIHLRRRLSGGRGNRAAALLRSALALEFEPLDRFSFRLLADMLQSRGAR
jgi:hypothetical protein